MSIQESIDQIISRIIDFRKERKFSMEYMADELGISVAAYNKIEKQETKLTFERLLQIQTAFDISLNELLNLKTENIYNQNLKDYAVGHQEVKNLYQDNRDLTDKLIDSLKEEISFLRSQILK